MQLILSIKTELCWRVFGDRFREVLAGVGWMNGLEFSDMILTHLWLITHQARRVRPASGPLSRSKAACVHGPAWMGLYPYCLGSKTIYYPPILAHNLC